MGKKIPICVHIFNDIGFGIIRSDPIKFESITEASNGIGAKLTRVRSNISIWVTTVYTNRWGKAHRQSEVCPKGWS